MPPPPLLDNDLAFHAIVTTSLLNNAAVAWIHAGEFGIAYQLLSHAVTGGGVDVNGVEDGSASTPARTPPRGSPRFACSSAATTTTACETNSATAAETTSASGGSATALWASPCCCPRCLPHFELLPFVSCPLSRPYCRDEECRSFILFDRPLIVETTLVIHLQAPELAQAAIHYNLGLLYQLESVNSGKSCHARQADRLYAAANQAVDQALARGAIAPYRTALMLLAIWNNRAHVRCWTIIDFVDADLLVQQMKTMLQQCCTPGGGVGMPRSDHRIFFLNALINDNNGAIVGAASTA